MNLKYILIFIITVLANTGYCQHEKDTINYRSLTYEVTGRDTNTIICTRGRYGQPDYKQWDSTYIFAHIIFPDLTFEYNEDSLYERTIEVMKLENIQMCYLWRDTKSLWMLPFSYQSAEMRNQDEKSSIGWIMITDKKLRL